MANEPKCGGSHTKYDGSWWDRDSRGIETARVCDECIDAKRAKYRPGIFCNPDYWTDEQVDGD
jgi:hypothetical protein